MSKDDTAPGLLSKLVKFVRNPATNWTELDSISGNKDDLVGKQLLNEMIERKRRNDFVRKREFDMLRKLRKLEVLADAAPGLGGQPSFFQSSLTSHIDDRATTLRKIDEIEAQMSMQWWKTNHPAASGLQAEPAAPDRALSPARQRPEPAESRMPAVYEPTQPAGTADGFSPPLPRESSVVANRLGAEQAQDGMAFDLGALVSPEPVPDLMRESAVHDAELEEAAILFANGDDAGAEAGLLDCLGPDGSRADHVYTWLTLFDLYRATGDQSKFEIAAVDFAQRFDRSAPQWFSLPHMVKAMAPPAEPARQDRVAADWICPSVLSVQSVGALNLAVARSAMPWRLDWSHLKTIEAGALAPLGKIFTGWASQPVQLRFLGDAQLQQVLLDATPSNDTATDPRWWQLRMEMLRIIHRPDDFELTALDFCVTFEVSPPAWEVARCDYRSLDDYGDAMGRATIIGEPVSETVYSSLMELDGESMLDFSLGNAVQFSSVELSGQIQGDAVGVMERLDASLTGAGRMQISCAKLARVDFSAAGMLLNWVSARQAEHRVVEFSEVNRLVAAFFNVIGIGEHAKVTARKD
ncbi:MAG: STAS domain-containing protein [Polaromonas sp.]|nr:STAS domain-containing protein [Polaromonas sp.]